MNVNNDINECEMTLREKLSDVIDKLPAESVMLSTVLELIGREGLLVFSVFLTLPFMVPVSIPGVSTVFGAIILLIGVSIMFDSAPLLPERFMSRTFPSDKLITVLKKGTIWLDRLEKISHPRFCGLTKGRRMHRWNGFMIVLGAVLLMFPFGLVPFSNTLPGMAILFLAVGILQEDGYFVLFGYFTNLVTIIYFAILTAMSAAVVREVIDKITSFF